MLSETSKAKLRGGGAVLLATVICRWFEWPFGWVFALTLVLLLAHYVEQRPQGRRLQAAIFFSLVALSLAAVWVMATI